MKLQPATVTMRGNKERTQITVRKVRPVRPANYVPPVDLNAATIKVVKRRRVRDDLPEPAPARTVAAEPVAEEPEPWPHAPLTDEQRKPTSRKLVIERQYAHLEKRNA